MNRNGVGGVMAVALVTLAAGPQAWGRSLPDILREKRLLTRDEVEEAKRERGDTLRVHWKRGLHIDAADGRVKLKLGGRIQNDWAAIFASDALDRAEPELADVETGTEFRRARLFMSGQVYDKVLFEAEYDFAGGDADIKDLYIGLTGVPFLGTLKIGHLKEPFSLEELTSTKYITFMERALPNAFAPSRNTGIAAANTFAGRRGTWAVGAFRETDDTGKGFGDDSLYNVTGRLTALPVWTDGGSRLLHLGLSYTHKFRNSDDMRFRQRPEAHLSPVSLVDSGTVVSDGADILAPEAALVWGPVSLQGEFFQAWVDAAGDNPSWQGYYVQASWFPTGEHRPYKVKEAAFDRVQPERNFALDGSEWGAWELALRYSSLDLKNEGNGLDDITAGVNWYLNPNLRVTANYVYSNVDGGGEAHIAQARFQVDF